MKKTKAANTCSTREGSNKKGKVVEFEFKLLLLRVARFVECEGRLED